MDVMFSRRAALGLAGVALLPGMALRAATGPAEVRLRTADGRHSAITVWRARRRRGTILFSHGALSSPAKYAALIAPWVAAGFDVWAPLHVDSTDHPETKRFTGLMSWAARIEDMRALAAHVGASRTIAAGHSYGALVALTLGGASADIPAGVSGPLADPRVAAAIAFSPPGPMKGLIDAAGYATLGVPALIQTGTRDTPPGSTDLEAWRAHLTAYDAAAKGGSRYALVLDGVDHYFGGIICRPELPGPRQSAQFDAAIEVSRLFLDGCARRDRRAPAALDARLTDQGPVQLGRK